MREQHDQRRLAHVGALAAHVGPGDDEHAAFGVEHEIVRLERLRARGLDHRMPAAADLDAGRGGELGFAPVEGERAFRQRRQHVELGQRLGAAAKRLEYGAKLVQQRFVKRALAHQGTLARRQHLVLEGLQLRADVALRALDGLAPRVVRGHLVGLRASDLEVVAMHAVVADLERGDAGRGALALLEIDEEAVGAGG